MSIEQLVHQYEHNRRLAESCMEMLREDVQFMAIHTGSNEDSKGKTIHFDSPSTEELDYMRKAVVCRLKRHQKIMVDLGTEIKTSIAQQEPCLTDSFESYVGNSSST